MTYQSYLRDMKMFRAEPMSEAEFNKMQGIKEQEEIPVFIARKSASAKQIKPTLNAHINQKGKR